MQEFFQYVLLSVFFCCVVACLQSLYFVNGRHGVSVGVHLPDLTASLWKQLELRKEEPELHKREIWENMYILNDMCVYIYIYMNI